MEWKIGCSGYHYSDWKGVFYPEEIPARRWFEFYSGHFSTLELNMTFYRFPRLETLSSWYARSPKDFEFTVKAPRHITHFKKFRDAQGMLRDFNETTRRGLREKLGCVLFQFPPNFRFEPARLERLLEVMDGSIRNVFEFRHSSWWDPRVFDLLSRHGIAFCGMSHPMLSDDVVGTTDTLYYRFHGVPHLYSSQYAIPAMERIALAVRNWPAAKRAYIYFNNTAAGHAVTNARQFQEICELVH